VCVCGLSPENVYDSVCVVVQTSCDIPANLYRFSPDCSFRFAALLLTALVKTKSLCCTPWIYFNLISFHST